MVPFLHPPELLKPHQSQLQPGSKTNIGSSKNPKHLIGIPSARLQTSFSAKNRNSLYCVLDTLNTPSVLAPFLVWPVLWIMGCCADSWKEMAAWGCWNPRGRPPRNSKARRANLTTSPAPDTCWSPRAPRCIPWVALGRRRHCLLASLHFRNLAMSGTFITCLQVQPQHKLHSDTKCRLASLNIEGQRLS